MHAIFVPTIGVVPPPKVHQYASTCCTAAGQTPDIGKKTKHITTLTTTRNPKTTNTFLPPQSEESSLVLLMLEKGLL